MLPDGLQSPSLPDTLGGLEAIRQTTSVNQPSGPSNINTAQSSTSPTVKISPVYEEIGRQIDRYHVLLLGDGFDALCPDERVKLLDEATF